ncbi:unnamed protein product [Paramecium primaurelia]|uniref:Uncharacterized protein n=1 Tax=Paramecium primaurelia TaxID=5886 RepID=A0A8S1MD93_PARPR|nr:unnamed protein product [Paramecium primaurelia]
MISIKALSLACIFQIRLFWKKLLKSSNFIQNNLTQMNLNGFLIFSKNYIKVILILNQLIRNIIFSLLRAELSVIEQYVTNSSLSYIDQFNIEQEQIKKSYMNNNYSNSNNKKDSNDLEECRFCFITICLMLMQNFLKMIFIFQEKHLLLGEITKMHKQVFFFVYSFVIQWSTSIFSKKNYFLEIYCITTLHVHQKHVVVRLGESIIMEFLSAYEINTARFRMWDIDDRQTDRQVLTVAPDRMTEIVIYDGNAQAKILPIQNLLYVNNVNNQKNIFHIFSEF